MAGGHDPGTRTAQPGAEAVTRAALTDTEWRPSANRSVRHPRVDDRGASRRRRKQLRWSRAVAAAPRGEAACGHRVRCVRVCIVRRGVGARVAVRCAPMTPRQVVDADRVLGVAPTVPSPSFSRPGHGSLRTSIAYSLGGVTEVRRDQQSRSVGEVNRGPAIRQRRDAEPLFTSAERVPASRLISSMVQEREQLDAAPIRACGHCEVGAARSYPQRTTACAGDGHADPGAERPCCGVEVPAAADGHVLYEPAAAQPQVAVRRD